MKYLDLEWTTATPCLLVYHGQHQQSHHNQLITFNSSQELDQQVADQLVTS